MSATGARLGRFSQYIGVQGVLREAERGGLVHGTQRVSADSLRHGRQVCPQFLPDAFVRVLYRGRGIGGEVLEPVEPRFRPRRLEHVSPPQVGGDEAGISASAEAAWREMWAFTRSGRSYPGANRRLDETKPSEEKRRNHAALFFFSCWHISAQPR